MALIENLEQSNWPEMLRLFFNAALDSLQTDPYAPVGSSVDDLRAWLRTGGIHRVRENLDRQMQARRFSDAKRSDVMRFLDVLLQENRLRLVELTGQMVLPASEQAMLSDCGVSELDLDDLMGKIMQGERPFEDWMHQHGHSDEDIARVYQTIDAWLLKQGLISPSKSALH